MSSQGSSSLAERLTGVVEIECVTPDLNGVPRGKVMTAEGFLEGRRLQLARGVLLQCIMGGYPPARFYGSDDGDLVLSCVPEQVFRLPWSDSPRAMAICDADELDGRSSGLSTRGLLKRVVAAYAEHGWQPVVATELEFFVFERHLDPQRPFLPPLGLDGSRESGCSAFSVSSGNGLRAFFDEVYRCMAALGLPRDTFMHEMGVSQFEINLLHGDPLLVADQTFLFKHLLREIGLKHGLAVVCMAKPLRHTPGSSMHIHQSVVDLKTGKNIFSNDDGSMSELFLNHIGGLQKYIPELLPLFAPNVNSFRRFLPDTSAPVNVEWGEENRTVGLRVPEASPQNRRVENRLAGADANPYLVLAASLLCGYIGMVEGLKPSAPVKGRGYERRNLRLPVTIESALERMEACKDAEKYLGEKFVRGYVAVKRAEHENFKRVISSWEREFLLLSV